MKHGVEKSGAAMKHGVEVRSGGVHKHGLEQGSALKLKTGGAVADTRNPDFGKTNMNTMVGTERKGKK